MNEKKIIRFNLYMSALLLLILIGGMVVTTIAYFTSIKKVTNTFTSGRVELALSEAAVKPLADGDLVEDPAKPRIFGSADASFHDYGRVYPGQSIYKDPTVTNTGNTPEWIAAKVIFSDGEGDLTKIMGYEGYEDIDPKILLSGGLLDEAVHIGRWDGLEDVWHNDRFAMVQNSSASKGLYEFTIFLLQPLSPGESVVLFDHIAFPEEWDNEQMKQLSSLSIHISAFGVQTTELDQCREAMTTAFPDQFLLN